MKQKSLLEPWIYNQLINYRQRTCLLPERIYKQFSERRIINDLKRHGINARIVKETHAGEDLSVIPIDSKKQLNASKRKKSDAHTTYIIEQL